MNIFNGFLHWLRDPFGNKRIARRHKEIQKHMLVTKVRAEDTTKYIRRQTTNPIESTVLGNRSKTQ